MSDITLDFHPASKAEAPAAPAPGYWKSVGQRILCDKITMAVTLVLIAILFITIGAPLVTHYDPYHGSVLGRLKPIGTAGHWLGTDEIESLKEKIRSSDNISSVVEQRKLLLTRLQEIDNQIADDDRERKMLSNHPARPVAAGKGAADSAGQDELTSSPALEQLKKRVTELRVRRSELLRSYLADAQPVVNVDAEIASLENLLRQGLDAKLKQQRQQAAALELALSALNAGEDKLDVIERERALAGENYIAYSKRREEARITEEMDLRRVSNIAVLGAITRPIEPVSPRKLLIMGIGAGFGLLLGISLALLLEYMNDAVALTEGFPGAPMAVKPEDGGRTQLLKNGR